MLTWCGCSRGSTETHTCFPPHARGRARARGDRQGAGGEGESGSRFGGRAKVDRRTRSTPVRTLARRREAGGKAY